jgi:hypothetical protein
MADVQQEKPPAVPRNESFVRHPVHAVEDEAAHLREIADEGDSPATFAIVVGAVLLFVVPLAAALMLLAFGIAHFA